MHFYFFFKNLFFDSNIIIFPLLQGNLNYCLLLSNRDKYKRSDKVILSHSERHSFQTLEKNTLYRNTYTDISGKFKSAQHSYRLMSTKKNYQHTQGIINTTKNIP